MFDFPRPNNVLYPKIWRTFTACDNASENIVKYFISDIPRDRHDDVVDFMLKYFAKDEVIMKRYNIISDPKAISSSKIFWYNVLAMNVSIMCCKEGSNEIAAVNLMVINGKQMRKPEDRKPGSKNTEDMRKFFNYYEAVSPSPCDYFDVEKYLYSVGLAVHSKYRRRGIAMEMLKSRQDILKGYGLKVSVTLFSPESLQKSAEKAGFETYFEMEYDDLRQKGFIFDDIKAKSMKCMAVKI